MARDIRIINFSILLGNRFILYLNEYFYIVYKNHNFSESTNDCLFDNKKEENSKKVLLNNEERFGSYLAGLFEGDGHIWIPCEYGKGKKKHNPRFCITFHKNELPLAQAILNKIGFGFIRIKKENAVVLTVSPRKGLVFIISAISEYLRTPKINQVNKLIDWLNLYHNMNIAKIIRNKKDLWEDNWLSGFIDADGSFSINLSKNNKLEIRNIKLCLTLEQRMIDPVSSESYKFIMENIAKFLSTNLRIVTQKNRNRSYYRIAGSSYLSRSIMIKYLTIYPLYSSKYLNYLDWIEASIIKTKNKVLSEEEKNIILNLKLNMNNKRTKFAWDHLSKSKLFGN